MKLSTLHDLMLHELKDVYSAERQLVQALPVMAKKVSSEELRSAMEKHLEQTEEHVERLKRVFEMLGVAPRSQKCKGMEGLIAEGRDLAEEDIEDDVLDAGLISAAQRIEHYEISAYGTLCEYASALGLDDVRKIFDSTLEEEKSTDQLLSRIAEGGINAMAKAQNGDAAASRSTGARKSSSARKTSGASSSSRSTAESSPRG